jgi:hypothetical protein
MTGEVVVTMTRGNHLAIAAVLTLLEPIAFQ